MNTNLNGKICYDGKAQETGFIAYANADWASDHISRRSVTGYIIKFAGGAVSWVSWKQKTVALSSTEAEYMCLSVTTWYGLLHYDYLIRQTGPVIFFSTYLI